MTTLTSSHHLSALRYPWHAKRAKLRTMLRISTPCSSVQASASSLTVPNDKENLRRQIVGLAGKSVSTKPETNQANHSANFPLPKSNFHLAVRGSVPIEQSVESNSVNKSNNSPKQVRFNIVMETNDVENTFENTFRHISQQDVNILKSRMNSENKLRPKIVRFRMNNFSIYKHKAPTVSHSDDSDVMKTVTEKSENEQMYEIRGNAIAVRKEGLKSLLTYKDVCTDNERRQHSMQTSLKIYKRRIKYNEGKFIQPNESSSEDYVIHSRSPFCDNTVSAGQVQENLELRQLSNDEDVRLMRSALQIKHNGCPLTKQNDDMKSGKWYKDIKCSYRFPENLNWRKDVSFRLIKDNSISNVKTYVLEQDKNLCAKFQKNQIQNSATLNSHNLGVHNSMTQVSGYKMKVGHHEISFDPRFLDWLEDSCANIKFHKQFIDER